MKARILLIAALVLVTVVAAIYFFPRHSSSFRVTGSLSYEDIAQIRRLVLRERAALFTGDFAPSRIKNLPPAAKGLAYWRKLREKVAGRLRTMDTQDGREVIVVFEDRWNSKISYDYQLRRTTNGWKIVGVGRVGP